MKNPVITFFDTAYGYGASYSIEAGRDMTEKELKKWWRHHSDNSPECIDVVATYEDEEGDIHDITQYWIMQECDKYAQAHGNIFN